MSSYPVRQRLRFVGGPSLLGNRIIKARGLRFFIAKGDWAAKTINVRAEKLDKYFCVRRGVVSSIAKLLKGSFVLTLYVKFHTDQKISRGPDDNSYDSYEYHVKKLPEVVRAFENKTGELLPEEREFIEQYVYPELGKKYEGRDEDREVRTHDGNLISSRLICGDRNFTPQDLLRTLESALKQSFKQYLRLED